MIMAGTVDLPAPRSIKPPVGIEIVQLHLYQASWVGLSWLEGALILVGHQQCEKGDGSAHLSSY